MIRTLFTHLSLAAALALCAAVASAQSQTPHEIVARHAGELLDELNARRAEFEANPEALKQIVREDIQPLLDVDYTARLILGRPGRGASDEQVRDFSEAVTEQLLDRYTQGMIEFRTDKELEVLPQRGELNDRATRVQTRVSLASGSLAAVDYVFRRTDEGWRAFDVIVEGISYVQTYRNQIAPQVQELGVDAVTRRIRSGEIELNEAQG